MKILTAIALAGALGCAAAPRPQATQVYKSPCLDCHAVEPVVPRYAWSDYANDLHAPREVAR